MCCHLTASQSIGSWLVLFSMCTPDIGTCASCAGSNTLWLAFALPGLLFSVGNMACEREAKLRRLNTFRRDLPYVSASALSSILAEVKQHGVPELSNGSQLAEATSSEMAAPTPYGPLVTEVKVASKTLESISMLTVNPLSLIYRAAQQGGKFANLMLRKMQEQPPTPEAPWNIVMYADEVVPGNQLSHDNRRKVWVGYMSFLELGACRMSNKDVWLCHFVRRSQDLAKLSAGIGQCFAASLKLLFGGLNHNIAVGGVALEASDGRQFRMFAKLGMILQDGGAHKLTWHCKGDAGTRVCMLCRNLVSQVSRLAQADEAGQTLMKCSVIFEDLDFAHDADIRGTSARLAQAKQQMNASIFQTYSQAVGFNYEPHGLLMDQDLLTVVLPASQFVHDWCHAILVLGVFHTIVHLLLSAVKASAGADVHEKLQGYVGLWTQPGRAAHFSAKELFSHKRAKANHEAKTFKCTASEGLSAYPLLAIYVERDSASRRLSCRVPGFLGLV